MGNVLCRHKNSPTTSPGTNGLSTNSPTHTTSTSSLRTPFDRIISRVQLCPASIHNRANHNKKNCNKCENNKNDFKSQKITKQQIQHTGLNNEKEMKLQKQNTPNNNEWQDVKLEAASLQEIKSIFADLIDPHTPIPPPRRHRQKLIEQTYNDIYSQKEPVYEEPCTKVIKRKHICKIDEDRFYKQHVKHHSTVSLPNINELQLSIPKEIEADDVTVKQTNNIEENKKIGRLENYMMRCRSFGSLLPNKLVDKLKLSRRINSETAESDDSWGGLEDWDLGVIEHYKPHDNSLPRPKNKLPPIPPVRKTDSLLRKHRKDGLDKNMENEQRNNSVMKIIDIPTDFKNTKDIEKLTDCKNQENAKRNSENETKNAIESKNLQSSEDHFDKITKCEKSIVSEDIRTYPNISEENVNHENISKNKVIKCEKSLVSEDERTFTNISEDLIDDKNQLDLNKMIEIKTNDNLNISVENFKPIICYEEKKQMINTPPPTPEILIPTVSPTFIDTHSSDHSTLMKLITEIRASNDDLSSNQNVVDETEFQQVSLSDILKTPKKAEVVTKDSIS